MQSDPTQQTRTNKQAQSFGSISEIVNLKQPFRDRAFRPIEHLAQKRRHYETKLRSRSAEDHELARDRWKWPWLRSGRGNIYKVRIWCNVSEESSQCDPFCRVISVKSWAILFSRCYLRNSWSVVRMCVGEIGLIVL